MAWRSRHLAKLLELTGPPAPNSPVSVDDAAYPGERLSVWVRSYASAGVEHLVLWADLVAPLKVAEDAEVVMWPRPFYTLARSALEAASQAAWVMEPTESDLRVERHLRLLAYDLGEFATASRVTGDEAEVASAETRLAGIREHLGREPVRAPGYVDLVKAAARWAQIDPGVAEKAWRLASAAAHGRRWFVEAAHTVMPGDGEGEAPRAVMVPDAEQVADMLELAEGVLTQAIFRFLVGSGYDLGSAHLIALEQLAEVAPLRPGTDRDAFVARARAATELT